MRSERPLLAPTALAVRAGRGLFLRSARRGVLGRRATMGSTPRAHAVRRQVNTDGKHALGRCERTRAIIRWRCTTYGSATLACYTRDGRTRRCRRHVTSAGAARRARASCPVAHSGCRVGMRTIIVYYEKRACAASPMRRSSPKTSLRVCRPLSRAASSVSPTPSKSSLRRLRPVALRDSL